MKSDIIIIGGGASGLMAAIGAAETIFKNGITASVTLLEKMPRPARKIMISGKGRCNFTNLKDWNDFSAHIRSNTNLVRPAFYNLTPEKMIKFLNENGLETVVERGDRAFPLSHKSSDVVDTLVRTALGYGVRIETEREVTDIDFTELSKYKFIIKCKEGISFESAGLIIATGGLSYPGTGSTGDGYKWAGKAGHKIKPLFPSLTAIVPKGYKTMTGNVIGQTDIKGHIDRSTPLSENGEYLCGIHLKNVTLTVYADGNEIQNEFGDLDFTDGGIEGPIGFEVSRNCVKTIMNGGKIHISIDMKPAVGIKVLTERISAFWKEISNDSRSTRLNFKEKYRILLGKLIPWELITGFIKCNPMPISKSGNKIKDLNAASVSGLAETLKDWEFDIEGFVGYERSVVTAGGISSDSIVAKTMESKFKKGLYFCGEILDTDSDTGGYNLQTAFSTGYLAGISAANNIAKS